MDDMEKRLRAVTVGPVSPLAGAIVIERYNPAWPLWFEAEASSVCSVLGEKVLLLEHVGSTSVPGLVAKPSIDIVLVVRDSKDEAAYVTPLEQHGYILRIREPDWHEHRMLKGPRRDIKLHVFSAGCSEVGRMLAFRDWLRSNPEDRKRYEEVKIALAKKDWKFMQSYADAKTEIVESILARAAAQSNSQP
jgi:GrpB-like predicted nucleotidyltransferase (UPF0157 family)